MRKHILSRYNDDNILNSLMASGITKIQETSIVEKKKLKEQMCIEPTKITRNIEVSDPDEFLNYYNLKNSRIITETVESSDADEKVNFGSTRITKTIEISDPDEFDANKSEKQFCESDELISEREDMYVGYRNVVLAPTKTTFTVEVSDPDEFFC